MKCFLNFQEMGELNTYHIYDHYEFPTFFSCKNILGNLFIFFWIEEVENNNHRFFLPVSEERLIALENGSIRTRNIFLESEVGFIHKLVENQENNIINNFILKIEEINEDDLPPKDDIITYEHESEEFNDDSLIELTNRRLAPIISLRLRSPNVKYGEIPLNLMTNTLISLQNLVDNVAYSLDGNGYSTKGRIPNMINDMTKLTVIGTYAGSFGVNLSVSNEGLFNDMSTLLNNSLEIVLGILSETDKESLKGRILGLKNRPINKLKSLIDTVINEKVILDIKVAKPNENIKHSVSINYNNMDGISQVINEMLDDDETILEIKGQLVAIDLISHKFKIIDTSSKQKYQGTILTSIVNSDTIQSATVNKIYISKIREIKTQSENGEEIKIQYQLLDISYESKLFDNV